MASNTQLIYYSNYSLKQLVDLLIDSQGHIIKLHEKLKEAHETIDEQADLIIMLQEQVANG